MPFDLKQLNLDNGELPDFTPPRSEFEPTRRIIGSNGVQVYQTQDAALIVASEPEPAGGEQSSDESVATDPLSEMAFRCTMVDDVVTIKRGFVNHVFWDSAWTQEELEVVGDTIDISAETIFPRFIYLKVPVKSFESGVDDGVCPFGEFTTTATIEAVVYNIIFDYTTYWIGRDTDTDPSFENVDALYTTPDTSNHRTLLATISETDGVRKCDQNHFGNITLPQAFNSTPISLSIAP